MGEIMKGIVKHYSAKNGYGFIDSNDITNIFFHFINLENTALRNKIKAGNIVSFNLISTERGLQAESVKAQ